MDELKRDADQFYKNFGIQTTVTDAKGVTDYIDSPKYKSGTFRPDIGGIHPSKLLHEMIRVAVRDKVKIFSQTAGENIKRVGQSFKIQTHRGTVTCGALNSSYKCVYRERASLVEETPYSRSFRNYCDRGIRRKLCESFDAKENYVWRVFGVRALLSAIPGWKANIARRTPS